MLEQRISTAVAEVRRMHYTFRFVAVGATSDCANSKLAILEEVFGDGASSETCCTKYRDDLLVRHVMWSLSGSLSRFRMGVWVCARRSCFYSTTNCDIWHDKARRTIVLTFADHSPRRTGSLEDLSAETGWAVNAACISQPLARNEIISLVDVGKAHD